MKRIWILYACLPLLYSYWASTALSSHVDLQEARTGSIKAIYAFGDSYSDSGEKAALSSFLVSRELMLSPNPPQNAQWQPAAPESYYLKMGKGRWTNGLTAVEVFADKLGAELINYAVGGAKSGADNYSSWLDVNTATGVLSQIARFKITNAGKADQEALYFIFVSANDYFHAQDSYTGSTSQDAGRITSLAEHTVKNIQLAIARLAALGAKQFFVVGSTDLAVVPWEVFYHREQEAAAYTARVNEELPAMTRRLMNALSVNITLFDHKQTTDGIRSAPGKNGFTDVHAACVLTQYPSAAEAAATEPCADPAAYYFWDEWHPTAAVHRIVGAAMYQRWVNDHAQNTQGLPRDAR